MMNITHAPWSAFGQQPGRRGTNQSSDVDCLIRPHRTHHKDRGISRRSAEAPHHQRPAPSSREMLRQVIIFTGGVIVEAGASIFIHNYRPVRRRDAVDARRQSDFPQQTLARGKGSEAGMPFEQPLRWCSSPSQRDMLLSKLRILARDPGPVTYVSSCAIFTLCLIHYMQHTSDFRHQNTFILCGAVVGLLFGAVTSRHETILVDALTAYLPSTIIAAQILSLLLHTVCSSWRDLETRERASTYSGHNLECEKRGTPE